MSAVVRIDDRRALPAPIVSDRILRLGEVVARTGLSRATLYRRIAAGQFPAQVSLGGNSIGWRESAVAAWIAGRGEGGVA